jgi:hypothetical protein
MEPRRRKRTVEHLALILARRGWGKTTLARRLASAWPKESVLVHDPMGQFPEYELIDEHCEARLMPENSLVIADEIDLIAPAQGYQNDWIRPIVHYGRHYGIHLIGCARRPANVHRDLSALASAVYLGSITEPRDLEYCVRAWGEKCLAISSLEPHQFLVIYP